MGSAKPASKAHLVAQTLRDEIAAGAMPPGLRLNQRGVAARFGLSATPVREALNQLAAEGILVHTPHQGVRVTDITAHSRAEFEEIYLLRATLERLAAELAHDRITRAELRGLERLHTTFASTIRDADVQSYRALNYSFHMRIYELAAAPRLLRMIQTLWTLFPWDTLWLVTAKGEGPDSSAVQHRQILDALKDGTAAGAGEAMAKHVEYGRAALLEYLAAGSHRGDPAAAIRGLRPSDHTTE